MKHTMREILAPAGAREQLEAAVKSGADAVYFGTPSFNARRNADNFGGEDFISAVHYCHERGVKVYVTLNTIVKDTELNELYDTTELIALSGADAVIVQDAAVYDTVKNCCPSIYIHASTQMAVHNVSGAKMLDEMGFDRIVLARELSIEEIKKISSSVNAEIEVFVHGAHCMSASGMCYMSSALGQRSGNRGLCAQSCRLNFKAENREYALSLKDMCLAGRLRELEDAGVCSFKIEGRMKRPEYVAAAVDTYRKALDGENYDIEALKNVFSRSGFTDGYAAGKRTLDMFGYRTKEDVTAAQGVLSTLKNIYKDEYKRTALEMSFSAKENKPAELTITDGVNTVTVTGSVPEKALRLPMDEAYASKSLLKLGGTFYYCDKLTCDIDEGIILPASSLNALRREAVEKLTDIRGRAKKHRFVRPADNFPIIAKSNIQRLRLRFRKAEQIVDDEKAELIILPVNEINDSLIERYGKKLCAELPALIYPADEERIRKRLEDLSSKGIKKAYCGNIGSMYMAENCGLEPLLSPLMNIMNSKAIAVYNSLGVRDVTLSFETSFELINKIKSKCRTGFFAYGHLPLMHFRCCPMQTAKGCGSCTGERELTDRRGDKFTVLCENRRYSVLYNPVPLYTGDKKMPSVDFAVLYFTNETKEECADIINSFEERKSLPCRRTAGLYDKILL